MSRRVTNKLFVSIKIKVFGLVELNLNTIYWKIESEPSLDWVKL